MSATATKDFAASYRAILLDALEQRCRHNPRYSQRAFARDLGVAPHRVSEILRGRQGMSRARAEQVAKRLELDQAQSRSFCDMVAAAHGRSRIEREAAATRLARYKKPASPSLPLATERFKVIAEWCHLAIVEALKLTGVEPTTSGLAARLGLPAGQIRIALERLVALGLVSTHANGTYAVVRDSVIGGDVPSAAVRSFHDQHLDKAKDALVLQPFEARDFNTVVVALDRNKLPLLKERLAAMTEQLNAEFGLGPDAGADAVYALTLHAFRLDTDPPHAGATLRQRSKEDLS